MADKPVVRNGGFVQIHIEVFRYDLKDIAHHLDTLNRAAGPLIHGGVDDVKGNKAHLLLRDPNPHLFPDNLSGLPGQHKLLFIELPYLQKQRIFADHVILFPFQGHTDMIGQCDIQILADFQIGVTADHLDHFLRYG